MHRGACVDRRHRVSGGAGLEAQRVALRAEVVTTVDVVGAHGQVADEFVRYADRDFPGPVELRALVHRVAAGHQDSVDEVARPRGRAEEFIPLNEAVAVGVGPAGGVGHRAARAAVLVVAPGQCHTAQAGQLVRQRDFGRVVVRPGGLQRRLAVAEQVIGQRRARRDVREGLQFLLLARQRTHTTRGGVFTLPRQHVGHNRVGHHAPTQPLGLLPVPPQAGVHAQALVAV